MQAGDGGQSAGDDGAGEADEGAQLVDVERVDGVEHVRGFGVNLSARFQQRHVGRGHHAQAWMQRNPNGRTAFADRVRGGGESAASVGDPARDLNEMNDGASEDVGIDFQPQFQRQTSEQGTIQLRVRGDLRGLGGLGELMVRVGRVGG